MEMSVVVVPTLKLDGLRWRGWGMGVGGENGGTNVFLLFCFVLFCFFSSTVKEQRFIKQRGMKRNAGVLLLECRVLGGWGWGGGGIVRRFGVLHCGPGGFGDNSGSIVMGAHWNTQKYITIHILMYFAYSNGLPSQYCHHYPQTPPVHSVVAVLLVHMTSVFTTSFTISSVELAAKS